MGFITGFIGVCLGIGLIYFIIIKAEKDKKNKEENKEKKESEK